MTRIPQKSLFVFPGYMTNDEAGRDVQTESRRLGGIEFDFDITVAEGKRGRRLAVAQAKSILEILEWFSHRHAEQHTPPSA